LSDNLTSKAATDMKHDDLTKEELLALLREVVAQRDELLSHYESMAFQVDDSTREVDEAMSDARQYAKKASDCEHHAEAEVAHTDALLRQLNEERLKSSEIALEFTRFREAVERAPVQDPWRLLGRAVLQIVSNRVARARLKFPPDSPLLPWFDRTVELVKSMWRRLLSWSRAVFLWVKPRSLAAFGWLKREIALRMSK
jgi:hypothetical protein